MSFADHKIQEFTHRIADLPDQPNLAANELKARFDSSPEELRVALGAVCDDADRLDKRVEGIIAQTFGDTIPKSMLADELQDEIDAKATQTALAAEAAAREAADTTMQSTLLQRCQVYFGSYEGISEEYSSAMENTPQTINLGFRPEAVLIFTESGETSTGNGYVRGGLCLDGYPIGGENQGAYIIDEGFIVQSPYKSLKLNAKGMTYYYLAFRQG